MIVEQKNLKSIKIAITKQTQMLDERYRTIVKQKAKLRELDKELLFRRDILENIDSEANREKDFRLEEVTFKIDTQYQKQDELKKKLEKVRKEINEERDKMMSKNTRKIKTAEILHKAKIEKEKNIYETDEMIPITETDKYISRKDNFETQLEKDINALTRRLDECLFSNRNLREEIDLINKEKENFAKMHLQYASDLGGIQKKIADMVNEASANQELRQELKNEINRLKDTAVVEQNKDEYIIQDIKDKYNKLNSKNKNDWKDVVQGFEPVSDLRDKSVANQKSIKKDIENQAKKKADNEKYMELFSKICAHFKINEIKELTKLYEDKDATYQSLYKQVQASESEKKSTEIELKDLKAKIEQMDSEKDKSEGEFKSAIQEKTKEKEEMEQSIASIAKKSLDLVGFNTLITCKIKEVVEELNLPVDSSDKLDTRMIYFITLEQEINDRLKAAMDDKLKVDPVQEINDPSDPVEASQQEELERNKQMEQTMKILMDSNLDMEKTTDKHEQIKQRNTNTLEKKDVDDVVERLKEERTSKANLMQNTQEM